SNRGRCKSGFFVPFIFASQVRRDRLNVRTSPAAREEVAGALPDKRKQHVVDEVDGRSRALDIQQDDAGSYRGGSDRHGRSSPGLENGDVARSETDRLIGRVDAALGIVRGPTGRVLKEPDGADLAVAAEIEPVMDAAGH